MVEANLAEESEAPAEGEAWGIIEGSLHLEAGARSQAEEKEDKMQRWMEEELDDKLQEQE